MTDVPLLPTTIARLHQQMEPGFVRVPEIGPGWFVLGPAEKVIPGRECAVRRWSDDSVVRVWLGELAAERIVHHREGSYYGAGDRRYVLVKVDISQGRHVETAGTRRPWSRGRICQDQQE